MAFPEDLQWNQPGVEPTQNKKNEGWTPEEKPPAEYFNWFFNRTCRAVNYLKTKSDESSSKFDIDGHDHDGMVGNGPKLTANNIVNTLITGLGTEDVQSTLEAIFSESKKKSGSVRNVVVTGPVSTSGMANVLRDRYSDNLCVGGIAISSGATAGYPKENAFDLSVLGTYWASTQTGTTVNGAAYIGYDFGVSSPKDVRKLVFRQSVTSLVNNVSSALVQWSDNGTTWTTAATSAVVPGYNTLKVSSVGAKRFWRLLANSAVTAGYSWVCHDLLMYGLLNPELTDSDIIIQPNALVAFAGGFDLVNKQPLDYWELTQQMSLTLAAADAYTVPLSYTDDLCNGGTPLSDSDYSASYVKANAFDNNGTIAWSSLRAAVNQAGQAYIGYDFGSNKAIRKIYFAQNILSTKWMTLAKVQFSDDNSAWNDALTTSALGLAATAYITVPYVGSHRYWRVLAMANLANGITWEAAEIEMYEALQTHYVYLTRDVNGSITVGSTRNKPRTVKPLAAGQAVLGHYTADLCYGSGGTPLSGGDQAGRPKAAAFDNSEATVWSCIQQTTAIANNAWIGYDFGAANLKHVRRMRIGGGGNAPKTVRIQRSVDGTTWVNVLDVDINPSNAHVMLADAFFNLPATTATRCWRALALVGTADGSEWDTFSFEMYEYVEPSMSAVQADDTTYSDNLCVGGAAISGGDLSGQPKESAFDGNESTVWTSSQIGAAITNTAYIGYNMGVARHVRKIKISQSSSGGGVSSVKVQRSSDAATWNDVYTATLVSGINTITLPASVSSPFWRILATSARIDGLTVYGWGVNDITMHEISTDINLYDPIAGVSKHYDGSTWDNVARVFVGEAVTDSAGNVVSYTAYPYNKTKLKALPAEDSDDVVTLGQITASLLTNGWVKIPVTFNGAKVDLLFQWGLDSAAASTQSSPEIKSFPIKFPNICLNVLGNVGATGMGTVGTSLYNQVQYKVSNTNNTVQGYYYIAIGI